MSARRSSRKHDPSVTTKIASRTEADSGYVGNCAGDESIPATDTYVPFYYYPFLQVGDVGSLGPNDVQLLEQQFCFKVPSGSVLHDFVRKYFLYVHPFLPLLDEGNIWTLYLRRANDRSELRGLSLTLFQALLFAAGRFVSLDSIKACGFETPAQARAAFSRRAELLLDYKLERDSITRAQTSLLLSLRSTLNDQSLNSVWLSIAIKHAKEVDAQHYHRDATRRSGETVTKKRLWWCCILRDRMIAIGVRRAIQITPIDFDFDQEGLNEVDLTDEIERSEVYNSEIKRLLVKVVMMQCQFAVAVTPTMLVIHHDLSLPCTPTLPRLLSSLTEIERSKTELQVWARRTKSDLIFQISQNTPAAMKDSVSLFTDMAYIYYHSSQIALCNYSISVLKRFSGHLTDYTDRLDKLRRELQLAAGNILEKMKGLASRGVAQYLPISAPACFALPYLLQLLDMKLSSPKGRENTQSQLVCYRNLMDKLSTHHDHTECVTSVMHQLTPIVDLEVQRLSCVPRTFSPDSGSIWSTSELTPSNWYDVFAIDPLTYLRLSLLLDISFSRGKSPSTVDLPNWALDDTASGSRLPRTWMWYDSFSSAITTTMPQDLCEVREIIPVSWEESNDQSSTRYHLKVPDLAGPWYLT